MSFTDIGKRTAVLLAVGIQTAVFGWSGGTTASDWAQLTNEVAAAKAQLTGLMQQAAAAGMETNYAYVSYVVLDRFQTYAQYDRSHPDEIYTALTNKWWSYKIPNPGTYHIELPFDEMAGCLAVASNAAAELQAQLATNIVLRPTVDFSSGTNAFGAGSCLRNGEPVFPSNFTWMPDDEDLMQAFGRMGGVYYDLGDLDASGTMKSWAKNSDVDSITNQAARNMNFGQYFIGHRAAAWMTSAHPEVLDGQRNFVRYDTDSPLIRGWFTNHWSSYLPAVCGAQGDQPRMHLLANEPNFATRTGGWLADNGVSAQTMNRYQAWLLAKYGTIANLNAVYGSAYADFSAARAAMVMPIDPTAPGTLQGGPVWYDWCRFNMDRVNDFFRFLKEGVQAYDPYSKPATIKVLGGELSNDWRDDGMDVEYLAGLMDVTGADCHTAPAGLTLLNNNFEMGWSARYALEWVEQSMLLDFYKSLYPDKPYFDSEWHGLDTEKWRDFSMDPDYVRSAVWMGFTHGMNMIQAWVWGRKNDGSFGSVNSSFIGEVLTQPQALDAYGRTLKELNAHARTVTDLVGQGRDFLLFYCADSAIQDSTYIQQLEEVYEALKLLNLRTGFTTPSTLAGLDAAQQTVVVPPTAYISDSAYDALLIFAQAGGNVVTVNGAVPSFGKNEQGFPRPGNTNLTVQASVGFDAVELMADALAPVLSPLASAVPLRVGLSGYGVLAKQALDPVTGKTHVCLINVSKDPRTVTLSLVSGHALALTDLLTGRTATNVYLMQPYDLLLLEAEDSGAPPPYVETLVQWGEPGGDPDIVSVSTDFAYKATTYLPGTNANPPVSTAYYPIHTGRAPRFNHAATSAYNAKQVMDLTGGDILHSGKNSAAYDAMFVWENELPPGSTLNRLEAEVRFSMYGGTGTGTVYWIVQKETGGWYASAGIPLTQYNVSSTSFTSLTAVDPAALNWYDFTPVAGGFGSIGGAASVSMDRVKSVGLYFDLSGSGQNIYADVRYFKALASFGTPSGWDRFVSDYGLSGISSNDFDADGRSDLYEYALGGNPTNPVEQGSTPGIILQSDQRLSFFHLAVTGANSGITYLPEWTTNLVTGPWTNTQMQTTFSPAPDPAYDLVEYTISGGTNNHLFFRLNISNP